MDPRFEIAANGLRRDSSNERSGLCSSSTGVGRARITISASLKIRIIAEVIIAASQLPRSQLSSSIDTALEFRTLTANM